MQNLKRQRVIKLTEIVLGFLLRRIRACHRQLKRPYLIRKWK